MSGGGGSARVPIPNNVRKTIQDIREITGKQHSDDEIYAVLKECSMDLNETIQKLFYLDTFHEVKRRRDRKKEGLISRTSEDSRLKQAGQWRGGRVASGGHSSNLSDVGGGRNLAIRRENGVSQIAERGHAPSTQPVLQKTKSNTVSQATRVSAVAAHGLANQSNGRSGHGSAGQSLIGSVPKSSSAVNDNSNRGNVQPQAAAVAAASSPSQTSGSVPSIGQGNSLSSSDQLPTPASGVYSSSLDPVLGPSISQNSDVSAAISREVGSQWISAGPNDVKGNKVVLHEFGDLPASKNEKSRSVNSTSKKKSQHKSNEVENNWFSDNSLPSSLNGSLRSSSSCDGQPPSANVSKVSTSEAFMKSSAELRQHVTFPNHFQVPEALKSGLTFGSFDTFGPSERSSNGTDGDNNTSPAVESSIESEDTATSSNQSASLMTAQGDHLDYTHSTSYLIEKTPASEGNSITGTDSKSEQPKQEVLLASESHPIPTFQSAQNYGLNFMSTMLGTQQVQFEGPDPQAQESSGLPNFVSASSQAVSSPSPTPPLQSSIPVSPQSVSIFRPPYPTNFFPYGPYYPPIYVSPIHQVLSHNGFPQQPSAGNMYLPTAAAAAGIKFPLSQFKAGANLGNTAHIGIPSGSFITPPVGYAHSPTVNTGSSTGNEDIAVSQLKENQIYTSGQLSEGSAVWIPAPGQDVSSLQVNSPYNLIPQGQHLTFPPTQAGHGSFSGIYQPGQTLASPSTLLQQPQAVAGPVETVGPPSISYQQPQPAQVNWNSNF